MNLKFLLVYLEGCDKKMNIGAFIVLFKLLEDSGAVSPKRVVTPPSSKAGTNGPNCGQGKKAILVNDEWVCVKSI